MVFKNLIIRARDVAKAYGDEAVLTNFNIDIWKGGIFGILGKDASEVAINKDPLTFEDPIKSAKGMVKKLKEVEKVDVVILLSHSGIIKKDNT